MMRSGLLLLGIGLLGTAGWLRHGTSQPLLTTGRHLVRPLVLPVMWRSLEETRLRGSPEEYVTKGRVLMKLTPEWASGQVHIASHLATTASRRQRDPEKALDRLSAAIRLLEESAADFPPNEEEYREAIIALVMIECDRRPDLSAAFTERFGLPAEFAMAQIRQIPRFKASKHLQDQIPFFLIGMIHQVIRFGDTGWLTRAIEVTRTSRRLLRKHGNPELAARWIESLQKLDSILSSGDDIYSDKLAGDPLLDKIIEALRSRGR